MEIRFGDGRLRKIVEDDREMIRQLGSRRASIFLHRLDDMRAVYSPDSLLHLPGHYHTLTGDRKGQWACDLDQPYRLIFRVGPENEYIEIIEIVNYHGK